MPRHPDIVIAGDEVLRKVAASLSRDELLSKETRNLIERMRRVLEETGGVGLAAPQIGVSKPIIILEVRHNSAALQKSIYDAATFAEMEREPVPFTVMINPRITWVSGEERLFFENCLSAPEYCAVVPRARLIEVEYIDQGGEAKTLKANGWSARILQHEIDHLHGFLCLDRMIPRTLVSKESFVEHWSRMPVYKALEIFDACVSEQMTARTESQKATPADA